MRKSGEGAASLGSFVFTPRAMRASVRAAASDGFTPGNDERTARSPPSRSARASEEEAFALGCEEGRKTVEAEFAAERDALGRLAAVARGAASRARQRPGACCSPRPWTGWCARWSARSRSTPTCCSPAPEAAAQLVGRDVEPTRLRAHPDDIVYLEAAPARRAAAAPIPASTRGAIVLETGHGWIEDGPAVRLDRLRAELDRMGAPQ